MSNVKWPTPSSLGGSVMEGKQGRRRRESQSVSAELSQLRKLQSVWQVNPLPGYSQGLEGTPEPVGALMLHGGPSPAHPLSCLALAIWVPFVRTQVSPLPKPLPLPVSQPGTLFSQIPVWFPSAFPSGLCSNITVSERLSQTSCTKDNLCRFYPSHLLYSSPWYDIYLLAISPTRCDRRDPVAFTALSPVPITAPGTW